MFGCHQFYWLVKPGDLFWLFSVLLLSNLFYYTKLPRYGLDGLVDIEINLIITKRCQISKFLNFMSKMVSNNESVRFMCFLRINIEMYHKFVIIYRIFVIKLIINSVHISKMNHLFQIENTPILIYSFICAVYK